MADRINVVARGMCIRASSSLRDGGDSAGVAQSVEHEPLLRCNFYVLVLLMQRGIMYTYLLAQKMTKIELILRYNGLFYVCFPRKTILAR